MIGDRLVDEVVRGFSGWKAALHAEEIEEHGKIVTKGGPEQYRKEYEKYLSFQRSPEIVARREYLYNPDGR